MQIMRIVFLLLSLTLVLGGAFGRARVTGSGEAPGARHATAAPDTRTVAAGTRTAAPDTRTRTADADSLALGSPLQSNMVIQANKAFKVWGWTKPGSTVQIQADWMAGPVQVQADASGSFLGMIDVPVAKKGDYQEHTLTVSSEGQTQTLQHLLIGEVWIMSGQSNMQYSTKDVTDSSAELAAADLPHMRLFSADLNFSDHPLNTLKGKWVLCSPQTVRNFSAVGYFFGRRLLAQLDVPVGIIWSGIGASAGQAFVPQDALAADTMLDRVYLEPYLRSPKSKEKIDGGFSFEKVTRPFLLYNAMIHPLINLSVSGFCWYQGETNRLERASYTRLIQTLVKSWRTDFGQGSLPFYLVHIAPYFYDRTDSTLAECAFFREAQDNITTLNQTARVTTMDCGEPRNLHPHNKRPIGERLAATALNRIYGLDEVVYQGPEFNCMEVHGKTALVYFVPGTTSGGLTTSDGAAPNYFTMAGADGMFYPAIATIEGDHIKLVCSKVKKPVAVRYAFTNFPITNFTNGAGWPAMPFRTDHWPEPPLAK
jgi:sialate O-acetylesterase